MFRTLFVFILCIYTCPLFAQDSAIGNSADTVAGLHIVTYTGKGPPPVPVSVKPPVKVNPFQFMLNAADVSVNLNNEFRIIDSFCIDDYYIPKPILRSAYEKIQILRTVVSKSDTNYMIGIQAVPCFVLHPKEDTLLEKQMKWHADKEGHYMHLSSRQLKKVNVESGRGVIYDLEMSIPFKSKYDKCKVFAAENEKAEYIALYYFYNDIKNKRIMKIIESQLGMVKFR